MIARAIKKYRLENDLSYRELSDMTAKLGGKVDHSTIYRIEHGLVENINDRTLYKLSRLIPELAFAGSNDPQMR